MKKILMCTDGSAYSLVCCRYAAWLAKALDARIKALYVSDLRNFEVPVVADLSGSLGIQPYEGMVTQLQELEKHKAKFIQDATLEALTEEGVGDRSEFVHETGLLVDEIGKYDAETDIILIGKRGENANFAQEHLGSMLERVIRSTKHPCLVTSRSFKPVRNVLVAFDGGESAKRAIGFIKESPLFRDLEVQVVSVAEGNHAEVATKNLKNAESLLEGAGLNAHFQMLRGDVEVAIAGFVEDASIDLLVAGAYGHSRIRKLIIGSTTTQLLRNCRIPVLCFR